MPKITDVKVRVKVEDVMDMCEDVLDGKIVEGEDEVYCEVEMDGEVKGGKLVFDKGEKS